MKTVKSVGEFGLIDIIKKMNKNQSKAVGIGDDCAVIPISGDKEIVVTTDALVRDVHFFKDADPYLLGRKSLAVNISDVAAMASSPKWAFLSISLEDNTDLNYIEEFMRGFYSIANEFGIYLLGGDTTKSRTFTINITLIGENEIGKSVKRGGAVIKDDVYVTGRIGCSYAGLKSIESGLENEFVNIHLNPVPQVVLATKIRDYANSMIDISDGLIQDCNHICEESSVGMEIDFDKIPFCNADIVQKSEMLTGGEDYELIFSSNKCYREILDNINGITRIGTIVKGNKAKIVKDGREIKINKKGFQHF